MTCRWSIGETLCGKEATHVCGCCGDELCEKHAEVVGGHPAGWVKRKEAGSGESMSSEEQQTKRPDTKPEKKEPAEPTLTSEEQSLVRATMKKEWGADLPVEEKKARAETVCMRVAGVESLKLVPRAKLEELVAAITGAPDPRDVEEEEQEARELLCTGCGMPNMACKC